MNISVILAHPVEKSFNHSISKTTVQTLEKNGHNVFFHDLYGEKFDPLLPGEEFSREALLNGVIKKHCEEISSADGIIIVHPNWWGQPPAILKGWVDRIIRPGVAYEFLEGDSGEGIPIGLLKAKTVIIFNTSNTEEVRELEVFQDPLETIWKNCIFGLCGVNNFYRKMFRTIITSTEQQRAEWLLEVKSTVNGYFPS